MNGLIGSMGKLTPDRAYAMQGAGVPDNSDGIPIGNGGSPDSWTQSDAAALRAGLYDKYDLAALVYHQRYEEGITRLISYLYVEAAGLANREKWTLCYGQQTLKRLAELAVKELLDPARYNNEAARVAYFGRFMGLSDERIWSAWTRTWRGRYQALYDILERWTGVAGSHIWHKQEET